MVVVGAVCIRKGLRSAWGNCSVLLLLVLLLLVWWCWSTGAEGGEGFDGLPTIVIVGAVALPERRVLMARACRSSIPVDCWFLLLSVLFVSMFLLVLRMFGTGESPWP